MKRVKLRQFLHKEDMMSYKDKKRTREMYYLGFEKFVEEETSLQIFLENMQFLSSIEFHKNLLQENIDMLEKVLK